MKTALLIVSHGVLGFVGWGIGNYFKPDTPTNPSATKFHRNRSSTQQADGSGIISRIETKLRREAENTVEEIPEEQLLRQRLLAALPSVSLPDDPGKIIAERISSAKNESELIEAAAQLVLWLRRDPAAALGLASSYETFPSSRLRSAVLELASEEIEPETLLPLLLQSSAGNDPAFSGIARQVIASRSIEQIALLIRECAEKTRSSLQFHITDNWPADRLQEFGQLATLLDDPKIFARLPDSMTDREKIDWLLDYLAQHPDQDFARRVRSETTFFVLLRNDPSVPLEERLKGIVFRPAYQSMSPAAARERAMGFLASQDVPDFLSWGDGPDLLYAFEHGRIEVEELLTALEVRFPEYAEAGLLTENLHKMICASDPVRADVLLADMSPEEHAEAIAEAISRSAYRLRLDTLQEVLRLVPISGNEKVASKHFRIWRSATDTMLDRYGSDYAAWISDYPEEADREIARQAIQRRIDHSGSSKALEIRQIVGDAFLEKSLGDDR